MHTHNGTLYPMLGVGAFMTMFWTGVVLAHELGLGCASLVITGLLCGCIATVGVCELQRRDAHGLASDGRQAIPGHGSAAGRAGSGEPVRTAGVRRRPGPVGIGRSLPARPC
jgi:hypothetical protein